MSNEISENKKVTTESEIGSNSVGHSKMLGESGGAQKASPEELELALVASQQTIARLQAELDAKRANEGSSDSVNKLAELLASAIKGNIATGPAESDNINRTSDFRERTLIDGTSLMEAQQTMMMYKNEPKDPISISKTFQAQFGPSLVVTVNGVRVAIPVDGKTYMINRTHCIHAKERLAKVDRLLSDTEPQVIETNA